MEAVTYKGAGVDIDVADATKAVLGSLLKTDDPRVLNELGAYGSLLDARFSEYAHPVLVYKTEEPGSKQLLAFEHDHIESVCRDMVNHLINDCIAMGARPLWVQDCIVCGKLEQEKAVRIVKAIAQACAEQECVLTGGEISEQPGMLGPGRYVLTSTVIGVVERARIVDGSAIRPGDAILGLASSGVHSNGLSLVRQLLRQDPDLATESVADEPFIDAVLTPHRCYYQALKKLGPPDVHGIAHITGGGVRDNVRRILPDGVSAHIDLGLYRVLPVFSFIREKGRVPDADMIRTFNLGVGMVLIVRSGGEPAVSSCVEEAGVSCYRIGTVADGDREVLTTGSLSW